MIDGKTEIKSTKLSKAKEYIKSYLQAIDIPLPRLIPIPNDLLEDKKTLNKVLKYCERLKECKASTWEHPSWGWYISLEQK